MQRIGLAGFGFIAKNHLEAYQQLPNVEVTAICTRRKPEELAGFTGTVLSDYDEFLRRDDVDVIDICIPTFLHEEYVIKAARAKKDVICEKPLTLTVEATERIMQVVQEEGVRLFVGHVLRFWPEYQVIKTYTDQWKPVEIVHAKRLGKLPSWGEWFQHPEKSGGALFDLHIHDIDFIYHLLGEVGSVFAVGTQNKQGAWDHVMTTLTFKNEAQAFVEASHRMPDAFPFTMELRVQSGQQALDFRLAAGENIEQVSGSQLTFYEGEKMSVPLLEEGDAFFNELAYFVDCLETGEPNEMIPLHDVLYVMTLMEAIEKSLVTGRKVEVV